MYTADNILGLKVTHRGNSSKLDNPGAAYTITETGVDHYRDYDMNKLEKARYSLENMATYLNEGDWILMPSSVNNTFPIY